MRFGLQVSDILVIGGGLAGLRAAYEAASAGRSVRIVSKGPRCSGVISGYNAPVGKDDSTDLFTSDIDKSGLGVNKAQFARMLAEGSVEETYFLESIGTEFDKEPNGDYKLLRPLGCTVPRLVHKGTKTGAEIERILLAELMRLGVQVEAPAVATELLVSGGKCCGALVYREGEAELAVYAAGAVVLAAGGCSSLYDISTYPREIHGDSAALAYRAGAELVDMEFIDFEPCCLVWPEKLRGRAISSTMLFDGGVLRNTLGESIVDKYFSDISEVLKSGLSRAMYREISEGRGSANGGVAYDLTSFSEELLAEHEAYLGLLRNNGIDPLKMPLYVAPAAHTSLGGIKTDDKCESAVPGLFVAGEAMGAVHGANRIGGCAGTEVLVFGAIAGRGAKDRCREGVDAEVALTAAQEVWEKYAPHVKKSGTPYSECVASLRRTVSACLPIIRSKSTIERLEPEMERILSEASFTGGEAESFVQYMELMSMTQAAGIIAAASLLRCESRGVFARSDFPKREDRFDSVNTVVSRGIKGKNARLSDNK